MARYTTAYSNLLLRLEEISLTRRLARHVTSYQPVPVAVPQVNALCRGGVVLLSSHIEGYVEEIAETAIDRIGSRSIAKSKVAQGFKYHLSRDLIKSIKQSSDPERISSHIDSLFRRDMHIWNTHPRFTNQISSEVFLSDFSNPTHDRISRFYARFGYRDYGNDLAHRLGPNYIGCKNMLDQMIDQRNRIAHGDPITTATPTDLSQMLGLVRLYCRESDKVVGDWFRSIGCPIR